MDEELGVSHAFQAGYSKAQDAMAGVSIGAQKLVSDLGGMMPSLQSPNLHPFIQARHGMYAHEMSFGGDISAMFGRGIPKTTTAYEYQELAARDFGSRIGTGLTMGAFHGAAAMASWTAGTAAVSAGYKFGRGAAQASRLATPAMRTGATALARGGMGALGVAGGLLGAGVGIAGMMAFDATVGKVAGDIQDRRDIMGFLEASSFRYATGTGEDIDQHFGSGFNRRARGQIASAIKEVDLGDSFYNMDDLKGVLESGTQMGMFSGAQSAEEFSRKFKNLTSTLKKVAKTLHTSLADGMKVIKDLKQQGFGTGADMNAAIMTADVLGTATGRTAAEMLSVGRQGAEMVRGTGIGLSTGSTMMQNTMANIDIMGGTGALSGEMIAQAGGKGQLAQGLMAANVGFMQSAFGRGVMAAATTAGGDLDVGAMRRIASGDASLSDIAQMGANNMPDPASYVRQVVNQEKNMREMAEQFGDTGVQALALGTTLTMGREIASRTGVSIEEGMRFSMKRRGMSESQIEAQMGMVENIDDIRRSRVNAMRITAKKAQSELLSEKLDIVGRAGDWLDRKLAPVSEGVTNVIDNISEGVTDMYRQGRDQFMAYATDTEIIDRMPVSAEDTQRAILRGVPKAMKGDSIYSSSIFTDAESESFAEGKGYEKLRRKYSGKENSAAANSADNIDDYAKAITGRSFANLTREEKMYIEAEAQRTGRTEIKQQLDVRQDRASQAIRNQGLRSVKEVMQAKDDAEANVQDVRETIIDRIAEGGKMAGVPIDAGAGLSAVLESKKGREKFDDLVKMKAEVSEIDPKKLGSMTREERIEALEKMSKLEKLKGDVAGMMRAQGPSGKAAANMFLKGFDKLELDTEAENLKKAKEVLETATKDAQGMTIFQSTAQRLSDITAEGLEEGLFGMGGEKSEFKEGVGKIRRFFMEGGQGEVDIDYQRMAELSRKAGYGNLSEALGSAARMKGPIKDMDKIRRTLGVSDKIKDEEIRKFLGEDEALDKSELLRFKVGENLADKTGSPTIMSKGETEGGLGEKRRETVRSIVDTQEKMAAITDVLSDIAVRLERVSGKRAF